MILSKDYDKNNFLVPKLKEDGFELQGLNHGSFRICEICLAGKDETDRLFWHTNCSRCVKASDKEINMLDANKNKYKKIIDCFYRAKEKFNNFILVDDFIEKLSKLPKGSFITIATDDDYYIPDVQQIDELNFLFKL